MQKRLGAFEWYKMMKAIAGRISIGPAGLFHTLGHHLFGGVLIVRFLFLLFFTINADGLMIDNR
jgi:hypothetical protein